MKLIKILVLFSVFQISANHSICSQNVFLTAYGEFFAQQKVSNPERLYEKFGLSHLDKLRNNYVPGISQAPLPKNLLPDYKPQFNLEMISIDQAPSAIRQSFSTQYETDPKYFAKKFKNVFLEKVFHSLGSYRYKGFCKFR